MEDFELYAMYRRAAIDHGLITSTWEGLISTHRAVWSELAQEIDKRHDFAVEEAEEEASYIPRKAGERTD